MRLQADAESDRVGFQDAERMENKMGLERGKIGGSDVSAIVGMNPYESAFGAWLKLRGEVSDEPENAAMERGRRLEPVVASMFAGMRPEFIVKHNRQGTEDPEKYVDAQYDFMVGHPDRLLYSAATNDLLYGLEIKTASVYNASNWGEEMTDQIPPHYLIQCQWYAGLSNLPEWRVAVVFCDSMGTIRNYREYNVVADEELFGTLRDAAARFWKDHVVTGTPPEKETVDATTARWIKERFPRNVAPTAEATTEEEVLMARYLRTRDAFEKAKREHEESEELLKLAIGDRDGIESTTFGRVTWKNTRDVQRVDYKGLCEELKPGADVLARYTKTTPGTRRFNAAGLRIEF